MGKKINVRVNERELENLTTDFSSIYEHAIEACKIRERIDDDDVEQILQKQIPESQMEKCFVACWLEQFQVVSCFSFLSQNCYLFNFEIFFFYILMMN